MTMPLDPSLAGLSQFAGQTAGVQAGLQQQQLQQQMQQFLAALQFQQQQAALSQAMNYGSQYGFAPAGNYLTWGAGGPTQPAAGTPTLAELASQMGLTTSTLQNALATSQVTGQFAQPAPSQYAAGTVLTAPSTTPGLGPAYGIINADGSLSMMTGQELQQVAAQRGTSAQALTQNAQPVTWNTLQSLSQGPPTGPSQQTLAAQQQQYQQALSAGSLTGTFTDPSQQIGALLQQGMNMQGQSFYSLPQDQQQYWLQYNQNNPQAAAQAWAQATNGALQAAGYQNPAAQPQQTLQALNQAQQNAQAWASMYGYTPTLGANGQPVIPSGGAGGPQTLASQAQQAQLSGMYQGAPTEAAREFNAQNALAQGQLGQQYLATAAQLQGPQNTFQQSNYLRGAAANPNVPVYLQALQNNMNLPSFQATGQQAPTPASMAGLAAGMGYGSPASSPGGTNTSGGATAGWNYGDTLSAIQGIAQNGAQSLGPGSLEKLTPDELQAFGSGLGAAGYSLPSFMSNYNASRIGQNAPVAAMGLS